MKVYLAGKIPKGDKEQPKFDNWRIEYLKVIRKFFDCEFIDLYNQDLDESDFLSVVGTDCKHIKESTFIIINAEEKLGVGAAQEMVIAKYFKKPVITILPKNSHHRRSNVVFHGKIVEDWIHPFIFAFSDFLIENIDEIGKIKDKILTSEIKDISIIDESIEYID